MVAVFTCPPHRSHTGSVPSLLERVEDGLQRVRGLALDALRVRGVPVQLDHPRVRHPGPLVQPVDVLRDDGGHDASVDQRRDGAMAVVGLGVRHRAVALHPLAPRLAPCRLRCDEVAEVDRPAPRPHPARAAEVRDPGLGADAGAGEHHRAAGVLDERAQTLEVGVAGDGGGQRRSPPVRARSRATSRAGLSRRMPDSCGIGVRPKSSSMTFRDPRARHRANRRLVMHMLPRGRRSGGPACTSHASRALFPVSGADACVRI